MKRARKFKKKKNTRDETFLLLYFFHFYIGKKNRHNIRFDSRDTEKSDVHEIWMSFSSSSVLLLPFYNSSRNLSLSPPSCEEGKKGKNLINFSSRTQFRFLVVQQRKTQKSKVCFLANFLLFFLSLEATSNTQRWSQKLSFFISQQSNDDTTKNFFVSSFYILRTRKK